METPATTPTSTVPTEAKTVAMLAHLLGILFSFIPSLIIWLTKKQDHAFIDDQAKEALNFQITIVIGWFVALALTIVGIGLLLFPVLGIGNLVFCIIGGIKANDGVAYRYPFAIRLIK